MSGSDDDEDDDDEKTIRPTTESPSMQSSPSQSFYASFKIYINRLSGRFNDEAARVSVRSGDDQASACQEPRVVVRIEELGNRDRSDDSDDSDDEDGGEDDDDEVFEKTETRSAETQPETEKPRPEVSRVSPPKPISVAVTRDEREESPVFYLDPADWVRVEGSSPLPVVLPVVAQEPVPIPEVTISPTRRKSSTSMAAMQNNPAPCEQLNSKLLLSPPHMAGCCGCVCRQTSETTSNVAIVDTDEQAKRRLRSKSYGSAHHSSSVSTLLEEHRNVARTTSSGSYLSTTSGRDRMTATESLLSRHRRRKVAIPLLCARAAAMVGNVVAPILNCRRSIAFVMLKTSRKVWNYLTKLTQLILYDKNEKEKPIKHLVAFVFIRKHCSI